MIITHLSLTNFRNYGRLEIAFPAGPTLLHGNNAQGKTNLLEAIYYLATTRSSHASYDYQLINWDALQPEEPLTVGRLVAQLQTEAGPRQIEMRLIQEQQHGRQSFRREALIDRRKVRLMDLLGHLRVVLFLPQDVHLVTGSPAHRRRYLDIILCQSDAVYCRNLSAYNKVLEQRNAQLKRIAESGRGHDVLPVFTDKLVHLGSKIFLRRSRFVTALARRAQHLHYEELTNGRETIRLRYLPRLTAVPINRHNETGLQDALAQADWLEQQDAAVVAERFETLLAEQQPAEIASGTTQIGPHRDDWRFWVNGRDLANYGSRGQQRSAILALKMAEIHWMTMETGETPILLLDEVSAELDEIRRALLLKTVGDVNQAILTSTDLGLFTDDFIAQATTMKVQNGRVTSDEPRTASILTDKAF